MGNLDGIPARPAALQLLLDLRVCIFLPPCFLYILIIDGVDIVFFFKPISELDFIILISVNLHILSGLPRGR